jgi:hypothetical protein
MAYWDIPVVDGWGYCYFFVKLLETLCEGGKDSCARDMS